MPTPKTKQTNLNETFTALHASTENRDKLRQGVDGGDCKQNVVDNKNVLTHVLVNISTSSLQLSHLTFFLI